MPFTDLLGRTVTLSVQRIMAPGAFLTRADRGSGDDSLLLPKRELPENVRPGDALEVFVYLDSEDRPIATTRTPKLELGEVSFLTVTAVTRIGAFVAWGMPKELLVPFKEQTIELFPGDIHPIGLLLDRSRRLCGTMRVRELLTSRGRFERDQVVEGEAWRQEPRIGMFCILERKYLGVLPTSEPHSLRRGEQTTFRIKNVLPDGKVELSLRGRVHEELEGDAAHVLSVLARSSALRVGDHSSPEQIRQLFGLSKKAFKRAAGRLLRNGTVVLDGGGYLQLRDG